MDLENSDGDAWFGSPPGTCGLEVRRGRVVRYPTRTRSRRRGLLLAAFGCVSLLRDGEMRRNRQRGVCQRRNFLGEFVRWKQGALCQKFGCVGPGWESGNRRFRKRNLAFSRNARSFALRNFTGGLSAGFPMRRCALCGASSSGCGDSRALVLITKEEPSPTIPRNGAPGNAPGSSALFQHGAITPTTQNDQTWEYHAY